MAMVSLAESRDAGGSEIREPCTPPRKVQGVQGVQGVPSEGVQGVPCEGVQGVPSEGVQGVPSEGVQGVRRVPVCLGVSKKPRPPTESQFLVTAITGTRKLLATFYSEATALGVLSVAVRIAQTDSAASILRTAQKEDFHVLVACIVGMAVKSETIVCDIRPLWGAIAKGREQAIRRLEKAFVANWAREGF